MSDYLALLREKQLGGRKVREIETKAFSSLQVYEVLCFSQNLLLAKFVVRGVKKEKLSKLLYENFLYFCINSEGSGEFHFKKRLNPLLDKINGLSESIKIVDCQDLPITSFELEKLKPISER